MYIYAAVKDSSGEIIAWGPNYKLYGTVNDYASPTDPELTYKDSASETITLVPNDQYRDNEKGGMKRTSDLKWVNVYISASERAIPYPFNL